MRPLNLAIKFLRNLIRLLREQVLLHNIFYLKGFGSDQNLSDVKVCDEP